MGFSNCPTGLSTYHTTTFGAPLRPGLMSGWKVLSAGVVFDQRCALAHQLGAADRPDIETEDGHDASEFLFSDADAFFRLGAYGGARLPLPAGAIPVLDQWFAGVGAGADGPDVITRGS
jgi:hypothetical protein